MKFYKPSNKKLNNHTIGIHIVLDSVIRFDIETHFENRSCEINDCHEFSCSCGTIKYDYPESDIVNITPDNFEVFLSERYYKNQYIPSSIERYCIERLINLYKLYEKYNYSLIIGRGYYGDEVFGTRIDVPLNNVKYGDICKNICRVIDLSTDIEKIKYILNLEGISLDGFEDNSIASIQTINPKDINMEFSQNMLLSRGYKTDVRNLDAIGVINSSHDVIDGKFRLIDAHRIIDKSGSPEEFPIVVISKPNDS